MTACPGLPIGAGATLRATLASLDCQVNGAVAGGYGRLFGEGGAFGGALTALLTIYVAVLAIGLMTGRTRLTLAALTPKVLALGLVLTFATAWPAYQSVVYGLLTGGPDQIASAFMGAHAGATQAFAARLDRLFDAMIEAGKAVAATAKAANLSVASGLVWTSAIALLLSTLGLLVIARIVLALLLALGPLFVIFGLFSATRGLFEGWLRTSVAFAFAPMLIVLGGSGVIAVLGPLIGAITDDPATAVSELRPIITLFVGVMIYAALQVTLMRVAIGLTRGWRLGTDALTNARSSRAAIAAEPTAVSPTAAPLIQAPGEHPRGQRVSGIVSAVLREDSRAATARSSIPALPSAAAPIVDPAPASRRADGLGQTFRTQPERRALTGALGS